MIPEIQPVGPPPTIPSAPQRFLPPTVGVPTATFQFEPSITLSEEYTDNFNLTKSDKKSNFRSTVSPGARLGINSPFTKGLIGVTFSPSYDTAVDDIGWFYSLFGQIVWQANPRWQLTVADTSTRSDQPSEANRLGLRQERQTFTTNTFSLTSDYLIGLVATRAAYRFTTFSDDISGDTTSHVLGANATFPIYQTNSLNLGYEYLTSKSEPGSGSSSDGQVIDAGQKFDVQGHQFNTAVTRQLTPLTAAGVKGSYALRSFEDETGSGDFQIWNAAVFARYVLPARLTLDASLGVSGVNTDTGASVGPNLFTATSLTYQFAQALVSLAVDRGFSETFSDGQNFGVVETEGITASLFYPFTPALSGTVSAFYRHNKPTDINSEDSGQGETENWGGGAVASWRALRWLLVELSYAYIDQTSIGRTATRGSDSTYTENRVKLSLRFAF